MTTGLTVFGQAELAACGGCPGGSIGGAVLIEDKSESEAMAEPCRTVVGLAPDTSGDLTTRVKDIEALAPKEADEAPPAPLMPDPTISEALLAKQELSACTMPDGAFSTLLAANNGGVATVFGCSLAKDTALGIDTLFPI